MAIWKSLIAGDRITRLWLDFETNVLGFLPTRLNGNSTFPDAPLLISTLSPYKCFRSFPLFRYWLIYRNPRLTFWFLYIWTFLVVWSMTLPLLPCDVALIALREIEMDPDTEYLGQCLSRMLAHCTALTVICRTNRYVPVFNFLKCFSYEIQKGSWLFPRSGE